jgi:hypothetical protein
MNIMNIKLLFCMYLRNGMYKINIYINFIDIMKFRISTIVEQ